MDGRLVARFSRLPVSFLAAIALTLGAVAPALADSTVLEIDWRVSAPLSGEVVDGDVEVTASGGGHFPLAVIEPPDLGRVAYVLRGDVRYEDVAGQGYLELWSEMPDGARYFSRTLATGGPLAAITRTSGWRPFELPLVLGGAATPRRLELNLVLPGDGTVIIGPVRIVRLDAGDASAGAGSGPTTDQLVGLIGGLAGAALGIAGGTIGWLVSRRRAPRPVLGALRGGKVLGAILAVVGVAALLTGQPSSVAYPLLLLGGIMAGVSAAVLPGIRQAYADAELRRIRALDRS
jgi:hypothetical protein